MCHMKIINDFPPNYAKILKALPEVESSDAVFCYGDTIYNPKEFEIPEDVIKHESIHSEQQGRHPDKWWDMYLKSNEFRKTQEIQAFAGQYAWVRSLVKNREIVFLLLLECARNLASPLYGLNLKPTEAKNLIKEYADTYERAMLTKV